MRINADDAIPGVRPSAQEGKDSFDLRILPGKYPITIKILDMYIKRRACLAIMSLLPHLMPLP